MFILMFSKMSLLRFSETSIGVPCDILPDDTKGVRCSLQILWKWVILWDTILCSLERILERIVDLKEVIWWRSCLISDDIFHIYYPWFSSANLKQILWFKDFGELFLQMIKKLFLVSRFCGGSCNLQDSGLSIQYSIQLIVFDFWKIELGQITPKTCHESRDLKMALVKEGHH